MAEAFKCDRCGVLYEDKQYINSGLHVGKMDNFYSFKAYDLCCTCRDLLEQWWSAGCYNVEKTEDIVVDPDKKCCYNCKYSKIDGYNNALCTNQESMSYNTHRLAERFYCKEFERKEKNDESSN